MNAEEAFLSQLIEELRMKEKLLDELKKDIDEIKRLASLVSRRMGARTEPVEAESVPSVVSVGKWINALVPQKGNPAGKRRFAVHPGLGADEEPPPSVLDGVRAAIEVFFKDQQFTAGDLEPMLESIGVRINSNTPRATISTALNRLHSQGFIEILEKGSGSTPNVYKRSERF